MEKMLWNTSLIVSLKNQSTWQKHLKTNVPMNFTQEDEIVHNQTTQCHICGEKMESKDKVRDHCHLTGKYRGPAHYKCNLAFKYSNYIPVFFHHLEGYDSHLLMQDLGKYKEKKLSCIAKTQKNTFPSNWVICNFLTV